MTIDERLANITRLAESHEAHLRSIGGTIDTTKSAVEDLDTRVQDGFRSLHTRLDYQGMHLQQHASQLVARNEWAESQDAWREQVDQQIEEAQQLLQDLRRRIEVLEGHKVQ